VSTVDVHQIVSVVVGRLYDACDATAAAAAALAHNSIVGGGGVGGGGGHKFSPKLRRSVQLSRFAMTPLGVLGLHTAATSYGGGGGGGAGGGGGGGGGFTSVTARLCVINALSLLLADDTVALAIIDADGKLVGHFSEALVAGRLCLYCCMRMRCVYSLYARVQVCCMRVCCFYLHMRVCYGKLVGRLSGALFNQPKQE
jgi:hypothetical protein